MKNLSLTKDARTLLTKIFDEYKKKSKSNTPINSARILGTSSSVHELVKPKFSLAKTEILIEELIDNQLLSGTRYAHNWGNLRLTSKGIAYMEGRVKRGIDKVVDYIDKLKCW